VHIFRIFTLELLKPCKLFISVKLDKILNGLKTLTPREHEVLDQVVSGLLNKEIASELGITIRTVKEHRKRIMEKMEANSLAELVTMIVTARLKETRRDRSRAY
jgi:FixJ family two-component response regulator